MPHGHGKYVPGCPGCQAHMRIKSQAHRDRVKAMGPKARPESLVRPARKDDTPDRRAPWWTQGRPVHPPEAPDMAVLCPKCRRAPILYNGNHFCARWTNGCDWAMPHPARSDRDRAVCRLLGLDYS